MQIDAGESWSLRWVTRCCYQPGIFQCKLQREGSRKLGPLYCGPFIVLEKYTAAYKLKFPPDMKIHLTFHVSQLKLYKKPMNEARTYQNPDPILIDAGEEEDEVEQIINHRMRHRGSHIVREYLILWKGYPAHEMTWEPEDNAANTLEKIAKYFGRVDGNAGL